MTVILTHKDGAVRCVRIYVYDGTVVTKIISNVNLLTYTKNKILK